MSERLRTLGDVASLGARHEHMRATLYGVIVAALVGIGQSADARITQLQITSQTPAFGGMSFGAVGPYETIIGRASGEVDPNDPLNAVITDVQLAPRNSRGMVEYSMDVVITKPVDLSKGNGTILHDVPNRGAIRSPEMNIGGDANNLGDGFLENQGFTLVDNGWEGDINTGLQITLPVATNPQVDADGNPIDGLRNINVQVPTGTYTGWNVRKAGFSEGDSCDLTGGYIPFFRTQAQRIAAGDPRLSLAERYPTHADFVAKVTAAANSLVAQRLLLPQDAALAISQANAAVVP